MAFWDWERWEKELDWMALHGINLPLALTGTETVWRNVLLQLGYSAEEIGKFIAGPGFLAWWHMNNLEGWGGPNPENWYKQQVQLQQRILNRMREFGIEPVFPGYAGMVPHDVKEKLGLNVTDPGKWCGFTRPAFCNRKTRHFSVLPVCTMRKWKSCSGKPGFTVWILFTREEVRRGLIWLLPANRFWKP